MVIPEPARGLDPRAASHLAEPSLGGHGNRPDAGLPGPVACEGECGSRRPTARGVAGPGACAQDPLSLTGWAAWLAVPSTSSQFEHSPIPKRLASRSSMAINLELCRPPLLNPETTTVLESVRSVTVSQSCPRVGSSSSLPGRRKRPFLARRSMKFFDDSCVCMRQGPPSCDDASTL